MLIEFSCPACKAQLSVEEKVSGRKVDCPKCKQLIIIPVAKSGLSDGVAALPDADVLRSAIPYRSEMMAKHNKLLEAIEEIKLRNERIRELETSSLRIQKELWAIEVEFEQRKDAFDKAEKEKRELKKRLNQQSSGTPSGVSSGEMKVLQHELDLAQKQITELERELKAAGETKADERHAELEAELKRVSEELEEADKINLALKAEVSGMSIGINQRDAIANQAYQQIQQSLEAEEVAAQLQQSQERQARAVSEQEALIKELTAEAGKMAERLKSIEQERNAQVKAGEKGAEAASLREEKLASTVKELSEALTAARNAEQKALTKLSLMEDRTKSLQNKVQTDKESGKRLAQITTSFTELERNHLSLEKKHETLLEEKEKLQAAAAALANLKQLEAENTEYVTRIAALENDCKRAQAELDLVQKGGAHGHVAAVNGKAKAKAGGTANAEELKLLRERVLKLETTSDELATENTRLKNTVRTLTENLKAQWKKRDAKIGAK